MELSNWYKGYIIMIDCMAIAGHQIVQSIKDKTITEQKRKKNSKCLTVMDQVHLVFLSKVSGSIGVWLFFPFLISWLFECIQVNRIEIKIKII